MRSPIRPWHEDSENVADLIWWLASRAPAHDHLDRELFRVRGVSDAVDILRAPHDFGVEWLAYQAWKAEQMQRAV